MKTATRKITALLFALIGMAPLLFIIFTGIRQQQIRHSMQRQLESKMLQTITLAKQDVHWLKEGKEILIDGRMFDVKSFYFSDNDIISFTGLYDDDETSLVNNLRKNQQNENNGSGKLLVQFFQLLQTSFDNTSAEVYITSLNSNYYPGIEQSLVSQFITVFSPPPQA